MGNVSTQAYDEKLSLWVAKWDIQLLILHEIYRILPEYTMVYIFVFMLLIFDDFEYDFLDLSQAVLKYIKESIWMFCIYSRMFVKEVFI